MGRGVLREPGVVPHHPLCVGGILRGEWEEVLIPLPSRIR